MPEKLSLVEEIMSKKFSYPSVKEARGLQTSKKKRRRPLVNTSIVDDHVAAMLVIVLRSAKPLPAKSSRKTKPDESQNVVFVHLPLDGSAYSDSLFIKGVADDLFLLVDHRRFTDIGPVQTAEWGLAHAYQV